MDFISKLTLVAVMGFLTSMYYFKCSVGEMLVILGLCGGLIYFGVTLTFSDSYIIEMLNKHGAGDVFKDANGFSDPGPAYKNYATTYGEILSQGVDNIHEYVHKQYPGQYTTFVDLGCCVGKAVVAAKLVGFSKTIGIEIVKERYVFAMNVKRKLPPRLSDHIEFIHGDAMVFDFESIDEPCVVFMSNLLWGKKFNQGMFRRLAYACKSGTLIVCSVYDMFPEDEEHFHKETTVITPMSWSWRSFCFVFKVL